MSDKKNIKLDSPSHIVKAIIHQTPTEIIVVRILKKNDGTWTRNSLVKMEINKNKNGERIGKHRGLNLDDMAILKKNWPKILVAMVK